MTKEEDTAKVVDYVKQKFGRLDILVNCAGCCPVQSLKEMTIADYNRAFDLDVKAVVDLTIKALPMILASEQAKYVTGSVFKVDGGLAV